MAKVTKRPHYQIMDGIRFPSMFSPKCFKEALHYKPRPDDVFICTYPRSGTTWMQTIALYIFRKGKELENAFDFIRMSPFIDMLGTEGIEKMPRPGAFKTHLPRIHIPFSPEAKYIYVVRNYKDCCVSLYHHALMDPGFGYWDGKFDDFFELFMAGEVEYNDYFDHLMSWYPHIHDSHVFFTKYEDMKKDTKSVVIDLAKFLGKEYIEAIEKDNSVLNNILKFSSFEYMKKKDGNCGNIERSKSDPDMLEGERYELDYTLSLNAPEERPKMEFVRRGVIGDWKNHLSEDQAKRLDDKFIDRTKGTEIQQWYSID